jgi:hypothetical protein
VSLACTISLQLEHQHNHAPLYYFTRVYWPQFASLQLVLPSFRRNSSVVAFHFCSSSSRCTATARMLTTIQTSVTPLNSTDLKTSSKPSQLPSSQNRAFLRRIAVFCDRVTLHAPQDAAARMPLMYSHHPPTSVLVVSLSFTSSLRHLIKRTIFT